MSDPTFVSVEEVLSIHQRSLADHGGQDGVRDMAALESAIFHPQNIWFYGQGDLFDVAAAYAFHIAESQAFFDGNKRTGMGAALVFLDSNGWEAQEEPLRLHQAMIEIAQRQLDRAGLAQLLRDLSSRR